VNAAGTVHRGSTIHEILTELERYPDTWYQAHQFPTLTIQEPTIKRAMHRLITQRKVANRLVLSDQPDQRGLHHRVVEIRSR
jgi:hypothetical protein